MIRHGAKLLHAFAEATVPRFTVVLRKAFGGAYITMNSKDLGADLTLAWPPPSSGSWAPPRPSASSTGASSALAGDPETERRRLADAYASRHLDARTAAREGYIDEVVHPGETRGRVAWALGTLATRNREADRVRNIPL